MRTFQLIKISLLIVTLFFTVVSCKDDNKEEPITPPESFIEDFNQTNMSFSEEAGEQTFSFTANGDWTVDVASTSGGNVWCKASPTEGKAGSQTVKITTTENDTYDDRSVTVTLKSGDESKTFVVTQKQKDAILINSNKIEVEQKGGAITIEVKANVNYTATIGETCKDWITESSNTRALSSTEKKYSIAANENSEKRDGTITFTSGDISETVHVYQAGGDIILLSENEYYVDTAGEDITVELRSNCEYEVEMPTVDWIHTTSSRSMSSHTLYYTIETNETYDSRKAKIVYHNKEKNVADTLTIIQAQKDAIVVNKKTVEVNEKGETIEVKLSTNVNYEMILPDVNWIQKSEKSRGMVEYKEYLIINENNTDSQRENYVVFRNVDNKEIADTLHIIQKGCGIMQVSKNIYEVDANGETIKVSFNTNDEYEVIIPSVDWIKQESKSRATKTYYETFIVLPNESYDERETEIIFRNINNAASDTTTIVQKGKNAIILSQKELTVKAEEDTIGIKLATNMSSFYVNVQSPANTWIYKLKTMTRALSDSTIYFVISKNEDYNFREGNIIFSERSYPNNSTASDTIHIIQEGQSVSTPSLVLNIETAGTLNTFITDSRKENIEEMKLIGELNGDDFRFIKQMTKLKVLDLSEVNIVEGGAAYYHSDVINSGNTYIPAFDLYTKENAIVGQMFPYSLQILTVPRTLTTLSGYTVTKFKKAWNTSGGYNLVANGNIATYTFNNYSQIKKIIFPDNINLKELGECTFYNCYYLKEISLPNSVVSVGNSAIYGCRNLQKIELPNSITDIASQAFMENISLNSIKLPEKLTAISDSLFYGCTNLSYITIPSSVTRIDSLAFAKCGFRNINLPNSIKNVASGAFMDCMNLTNITLPNTITKLEYFTLAGTRIATVNLPSSIVEIGPGAFFKCTQLSKLTIPNNIEKIGYSAFQGCSNLNEIVLPNKLNTISAGLFKECYSLKEITIPESVVSIEQEAFNGCNLQTLNIPNNVTDIGDNAFYNNNNLSKITFGTGLKSIGISSFAKKNSYNDNKIYYTEVICLGKTPAQIVSNSFNSGINKESKLYIPQGTYNAYYLSEWANIFSNIIEK